MNVPARRPWLFALVAALLALHWALAVGSKLQQCTTSDELVHLTGGFSYWNFHDYRLHPENGNLPQRWAALPAWLAGASFPVLPGNEYWRTSDVWVLGHQFFYELPLQDHFPLLMAGRAMIALFGVATGLLIFGWSRAAFGPAGALVSLTLFVFDPNFLAHDGLVTSDACMVFFLLASCGLWWRHLHDGSGRTWWLSAGVFGLACVAKYSAVMLPPMMLVMAAVRSFGPEPLRLLGRTWPTRGKKLTGALLSAAGHGAVGVVVIWAFFGFRFEAFNPALPPAAHFIRPWDWLDLHIGTAGKFVRALADWRALPEGFLYGFAYVLETAQIRSAYLNGEFSVTGWRSFFLWAFALKTTLPILLAIGGAGFLALRRWRTAAGDRLALWRRDLYRFTPLIVLFTVYWAFSIASNLNIGHRHILPTYPVLFIAAGALGSWLRSRRIVPVAAILLGGAWHIGEAVRVAPSFLAYFNSFAGGPAGGHRHLVDSSLDWGQDLPGLQRWFDTHARGEKTYLSYFGTGEPDYYRIRARRLPFVNGFKIIQPWVPLEPGVYAIGATMLSHVYSPIRGPWTLELEKEWQQSRGYEPVFAEYFANAQRRAEMDREAGDPRKWRTVWTRHDVLRFARLCHYLRVRDPDDHIGWSIFLYRLTAEEIHAATGGTVAEWAAAIERAASRPR